MDTISIQDEFLAALSDIAGMEVRERTLDIKKGGFHKNATASCHIYVPASEAASGRAGGSGHAGGSACAGRDEKEKIVMSTIDRRASAEENLARVAAQAGKVRSMKVAKAPKEEIAAEVSPNRTAEAGPVLW